MELCGESVTGPMLLAKWEHFEEKMEIPEDERLGVGWLDLFKKACTISLSHSLNAFLTYHA